jgi:hypothetical protein
VPVALPVILGTQEAEIRRITVWSQPKQIVPWHPISKKVLHKNKAGGVAQGEALSSNPRTAKKKNYNNQAPVAHNCNPSYSRGRCKKSDVFYQSICYPLRLLKNSSGFHLRWLACLKSLCFFFQIPVGLHCPPNCSVLSPKPFSQSW